jgi:hypothetical protein
LLVLHSPKTGAFPPVLRNAPYPTPAAIATKITPDSKEQDEEQDTTLDLKTEASPVPLQKDSSRRRSSRQNYSKVAPVATPAQNATQPTDLSSTPNAILPDSKRNTTQSKQEHEKSRWTCALEAIEEAIPANVKTFLRPYLCGVL